MSEVKVKRLSAELESEARAMLAKGDWFAVYPAKRAAELLAELDAVRAERDAQCAARLVEDRLKMEAVQELDEVRASLAQAIASLRSGAPWDTGDGTVYGPYLDAGEIAAAYLERGEHTRDLRRWYEAKLSESEQRGYSRCQADVVAYLSRPRSSANARSEAWWISNGDHVGASERAQPTGREG